MKLTEYLVSQDCISARKIVGPNGAFISATRKDDTVITLPVGHKSQNGKLNEYNVFVTEDGTAIATVSEYKEIEQIEL